MRFLNLLAGSMVAVSLGVAGQDAPAKKTQADLDFEHEMAQSDGVNHPRQKIGDQPAKELRPAAPAKKTQQDLDREHEQLQSDGKHHPREVIKK